MEVMKKRINFGICPNLANLPTPPPSTNFGPQLYFYITLRFWWFQNKLGENRSRPRVCQFIRLSFPPVGKEPQVMSLVFLQLPWLHCLSLGFIQLSLNNPPTPKDFKGTLCEKIILIHGIRGSFLVVMVLVSTLKDICNSHNLTKYVQR